MEVSLLLYRNLFSAVLLCIYSACQPTHGILFSCTTTYCHAVTTWVQVGGVWAIIQYNIYDIPPRRAKDLAVANFVLLHTASQIYNIQREFMNVLKKRIVEIRRTCLHVVASRFVLLG
jgi:hypothetical protein